MTDIIVHMRACIENAVADRARQRDLNLNPPYGQLLETYTEALAVVEAACTTVAKYRRLPFDAENIGADALEMAIAAWEQAVAKALEGT